MAQQIPTLPEESVDRMEGEAAVRAELGLPMFGASGASEDGGVVATSAANEGEIIGVLSYAYGAVWSRPGLTTEERCYITLAVLAAQNQTRQLQDYVRACLRAGVEPEDVLEVMLQTGIYAGLSYATGGMEAAREVFLAEGVATVDENVTTIPPMSQQQRFAEFMRVAQALGIGRVGMTADAPRLEPLPGGAWSAPSSDPQIENDLNVLQGALGYGEVWGRERLGFRNRSMITMAVLQAKGQDEQFHYHVNNALNLGLTRAEIHEVLLQAGVYSSISGWQNASNVARHVFAQRAESNSDD